MAIALRALFALPFVISFFYFASIIGPYYVLWGIGDYWDSVTLVTVIDKIIMGLSIFVGTIGSFLAAVWMIWFSAWGLDKWFPVGKSDGTGVVLLWGFALLEATIIAVLFYTF